MFSKIFEKIICRRFVLFWEKRRVLYKYQFGFRKNHSTTLALMEIIDKIYNELDEGNFVTGIYFDLQKAFDTVHHEISLCKLYSYGIRDIMYEWVKDYLSNRYEYTNR